ncbi:MAG: hypothetical protein JOZ51_13680 [Chloroflexi bacterium]|nr:hypothetical protein [Chloroflexota bacterium]
MVEEKEVSVGLSRLPIWWQVALGYAALGVIGWLMLGIQALSQRNGVRERVAALIAQGDSEAALAGINYAGSLSVDMGVAFVAAAIFAFVAAALFRRTWNAWDYATLVVGFAGVLSLIFLCARGRILVGLPITMLPLLALLYVPGLKTVMNVGERERETPEPEQPATSLSRDEIEREIARERTLISQLSQNLDVFEVERAMDTDVFMLRYTQGLEEESSDNAEWFSIGRAVRRSRERVATLLAQLEALPD